MGMHLPYDSGGCTGLVVMESTIQQEPDPKPVRA